MPTSKKYLLVRPRGGLNDCFNQIFKCFHYARQTERTLLIDTTRSEGIRLEFSEAFQFHESSNIVIGSTKNFPDGINRCSTSPSQIHGRVNSYKATLAKDKHTYLCSLSGAPITFDFKRSYSEELIVHEQWGGGHLGIALFSKIQASEWLRNEMKKALATTKKFNPYIGVHIRYSDYRCDYEEFLKSLSRRTKGRNVLICSDSTEVRKKSIKIMDKSNVFFISGEIETGGSPIHLFVGDEGYEVQKKALLNSFLDLLGLCQASSLYFPKLNNGGGVMYSGFSILAKGVREKKLIEPFLGI